MRFRIELFSIFPLENWFLRKNLTKTNKYRYTNKYTNKGKLDILTETPLTDLNLIINIFLALHTKIPKLSDKKNLDMVVKML